MFSNWARYFLVAAVALPTRITIADPGKDNYSAGESTIEVTVTAPREPRPAPSESFQTPATLLRYDPRIDVQTRNFAAAQADVSIRGGTFENSGFQIGAAQLRDSQTGHYVAELPIGPQMLRPIELLTGFENDVFGNNATGGTISFGWAPIESMTAFYGAIGSHGTHSGELYSGWSKLADSDSGSLNMDISAAGSESEGSRPQGASHLSRGNIRFQFVAKDRQTDLFLGRQNKFFAWPYLYALQPLHELVGSSGIESEDITSTLVLLNHRATYGNQSYYELGASARDLKDDYEFDRFNPGLFNPFEHTTQRSALSAKGIHFLPSGDLTYHTDLADDDIDSSALTFGDFDSRRSFAFALVPGKTYRLSSDYYFRIQAGAGLTDTNREHHHLSPLVRIAVTRTREHRTHELYVSLSHSNQVPSFTALSSNPNAGLFRGNPNLADEITRSFEIGSTMQSRVWSTHGALFVRSTSDLTDWIYDSAIRPFAARSAANVDVTTFGGEFVANYDASHTRLTGSYAYLHKDFDEQSIPFGGSFYAQNFPTHRATAAVSYMLSNTIEISSAVEFRHQFPNSLRNSEDKTYLLQRAALSYRLNDEIALSLSSDNLWKENFEEVPGVPGAGRIVLLGISISKPR